MAARLNTTFSASKVLALPIRTRKSALTPRWQNEAFKVQNSAITRQTRSYADKSKDLPASADGKGMNTESLPHVSEEQAATSRAMGTSGPDLSQGTPIEEVVKNDPAAQDKLPKVMQQELSQGKSNTKPNDPTKPTRRQYSTSAIQRAQEVISSSSSSSDPSSSSVGLSSPTPAQPPITSQKFGLPSLPLPAHSNLKYRYSDIVTQLVGLVILDGKKADAQRCVDYVLSYLRSSPPPQIRADRPLLPGHPPPSHLPLNPVLYLQLAIDSVAPMMRLRSQKGAAGGGVALQIPVPLYLRQRRRTAIMWIVDAAKKRKNRGSGKDMFAQRLAEEIVAVVEGKSGAWEKRNGIHKLGVAARANLLWKPKKR